MNSNYTVSLDVLVEDLSLEVICLPCDKEKILISSMEINRPGLLLSGFFDYFEPQRIQIFGRMEYAYLKSLDEFSRMRKLEDLFSKKIPALIITRDQEIFPEMMEYAKKYSVPILRSSLGTSNFMSIILRFLTTKLAPRITRHGVLIEIYGEGVLILGESGVGKSETAIELMKRGHRLVADDAVEIKKFSKNTLVGTAPENIRHFIELRGIGIVNARRLFGTGSVKVNQKINLVAELEPWDSNKEYDRIGMESNYMTILDVEVPSLIIPIKPGRNLAVILEVAAINNRQKKMGYNAAKDLLEGLKLERGS